MASKKIQTASINKKATKKVNVATNNSNTSTSPMTRNEAKAAAISASKGDAKKVLQGKYQPVATLPMKKKDEEGTKKLPSNYENSISGSLSPCPIPLRIAKSFRIILLREYASHDYRRCDGKGATGYKWRTIEKLTKTMEDKDLQIASVMNKLEAQNAARY